VTAAGGTTSSTLATRFGRIKNVKDDFGAKGDGSDDTAPVQAAFDEGFNNAGSNPTPLFIPAGTYNILSAPLLITNVTGIWLFGDGREQSFLADPNGSGCIIATAVRRSVFERIKFLGQQGGGATGILFDLLGGGSSSQANAFRDIDFDGDDQG